jgi:S-adenosylmethionine/arginine decarboxylase-like enzyme
MCGKAEPDACIPILRAAFKAQRVAVNELLRGRERATLLHIHLHHFHPNGVSGVAVLAESHISIHTWPDIGYAALDVFMCGKAEPDACIPILRAAFKAQRVAVNELLRGREP